MYKIQTVLNDEPISFTVIVGQDESEIDELVQFRLNELINPPTSQETTPTVDLQNAVQQLKNELNAVKAELQNFKKQINDDEVIHSISVTKIRKELGL